MKTAISLPDEIFEQAERMARRLKKSRSEIYREAVVEYVARHDPDAVTQAMNYVVDSVGGERDDFGKTAARRVLERSEW
jgi:metal-responsive CopG/Arc/MetJ family transcriptional regulator